VYQIDAGCRRLLWVGRERKEKTLEGFFDLFETSVKEHLRFVCSDMWKPYLNVIADRAGLILPRKSRQRSDGLKGVDWNGYAARFSAWQARLEFTNKGSCDLTFYVASSSLARLWRTSDE
jgi:transposase